MLRITKERLNNFELLRILSMLMVVFLHVLSFTGLLSKHSNGGFNYYIVWGLESLSFVAVNCFVLISGYFLIDSSFKWKKIFKLWLKVFFYSIVLFFLLSPLHLSSPLLPIL